LWKTSGEALGEVVKRRERHRLPSRREERLPNEVAISKEAEHGGGIAEFTGGGRKKN